MKEKDIERLVRIVEDDILAGNSFDGNDDALKDVIAKGLDKANVWGTKVYTKRYKYRGEERLKVEVTPGMNKDWDIYVLHENGVIDYSEKNNPPLW